MRGFLREFRDFAVKGNLVEVAVGLVLALAFVALVNAFIADFVTPIIAAIAGKPDFSRLTFTISRSSPTGTSSTARSRSCSSPSCSS